MKSLAPNEIIAESFRIIDSEMGSHDFSDLEWPVVRRMIHACGDLELARLVRFSPNAVSSAINALREGTPIVTDVRMVAIGIQQTACEALGGGVHCFLEKAGNAELANESGKTRCASAMERAIAAHPNAIFAIGNAPTALAVLSEAVHRGSAQPSLIMAMPVGFVGVVESKAEVNSLPVPWIMVEGRRGGSALAAAAVNALLVLALEGVMP